MTAELTELRAVSSGMGQQTMALLVLSARGVVDFPVHVFANVGERAEKPATLSYLRTVAMPYAAAHGIELIEVAKRDDEHRRVDLYDRLTDDESRSLPIPVRMDNGAPGRRACTADYKIRVVTRELRRRGATRDRPATVAVGFSVDEPWRLGTRRPIPTEREVYPLVDLRLRRADCQRIIRDEGLPVPPSSSCWFCPFHRLSTWQTMRADEPDTFERAADLEDQLNARRARLGRDPVYLTCTGVPLRRAIPDGVATLPFPDLDTDDGCASGRCFT